MTQNFRINDSTEVCISSQIWISVSNFWCDFVQTCSGLVWRHDLLLTFMRVSLYKWEFMAKGLVSLWITCCWLILSKQMHFVLRYAGVYMCVCLSLCLCTYVYICVNDGKGPRKGIKFPGAGAVPPAPAPGKLSDVGVRNQTLVSGGKGNAIKFYSWSSYNHLYADN